MRAHAACSSIIVTVLAAGPLHEASAEELRLSANAGASTEWNDNLRLSAGNVDPVVGLVSDVGMQVGWGAENWQWNLTPRVQARRYTGDTELDSRNWYARAGFVYTGETGKYDAGASYSNEKTVSSDFSSTGVLDANIPRESVGLNLGAEQGMTERVSLTGRLAYDDVSYEDGLRYGVFDYRYVFASGSARYAVNERTQVSLVTRVARLEIPATGGWSRELSAGLGIDHAWNERWRINLAAGPTYSAFKFGDSNTGSSYRASVSGAWERTRLDISAERLLSPDAARGRLQIRDAMSASLSQRYRETMDVEGFVRSELYSDVNDRLADFRNDTGTLRAGFGINWRPSTDWSWRAVYTYSLREGDGSPDSNQLILGMTWHGWTRSIQL